MLGVCLSVGVHDDREWCVEQEWQTSRERVDRDTFEGMSTHWMDLRRLEMLRLTRPSP